ncbi:ankyrin repeat-containing domain protein [Tricladium varicosporioides]|nr:ankyrin repeat-containing domain protein [Hymenoscyphus varicosporioides]
MNIVKTVAPIAIEEAFKYASKHAVSDSSQLAKDAQENNTSAIKNILRKNPNVDRGPALVAAAGMGNLSSLDILLSSRNSSHHHGRHSDSPSRDSNHEHHRINLNVWSSGSTPLLSAVSNKHVKTTRLLLQNGADPDLCPQTGVTALHMAAQAGDIDIVEELLCFEAEIDHRDARGDTALIIASRCGWARTAKVLLDNGADIEAVNKKGGSSLLVAARHSRVDVVKMLVRERADINVKDKKGRGVLHRAVEGVGFIEGVPVSVKEELLQILLKAGADPKVKDNDGKTAAERATWLTGGEKLRTILFSWQTERKRRGSSDRRRRDSKEPDRLGRSKTM